MSFRCRLFIGVMLLSCFSAFPRVALPQAISINVGARGAHFQNNPLQPGEAAGAYVAANWNDFTLNSFAQQVPSAPAGTLKDSTGVLVPNFAFSIIGSLGVVDTYNYAADPQNPAGTPNLKLMGGFIKGPYEPTIGLDIKLQAVPYAQYDLYIYVDGFGTGVTGWDLPEIGQSFYSVDASPINFLSAGQVLSEYHATTLTDANAELASPSAAHNYMKISGLTSPDLTLLGLRPGGGEEAIGGIQIVNTTPISGDYDKNRIVDGNDFLLWQRTLGSTTDLAADGDGSNKIDAGDLVVWRTAFNPHLAASVSSVPEPAMAVLIVIAAAALHAAARRRKPQLEK